MPFHLHTAFVPFSPLPSSAITTTSPVLPCVPRHPVITPHACAAPPPRRVPSPVRTAALAALAASLLTLSPSLPDTPLTHVEPAQARPAARGGGASFLSASGEVIKDPEALLRWSLPISNKPVRSLQSELEGSISDLKGLKWSSVEAHVKRAAYVLNNQTPKILTDVPEPSANDAAALLARVADALPPLDAAVAERSTEKVTRIARDILHIVGDVEQLMVTDFPYSIPSEYKGLPWLRGRATVDLVVRKANNEQFDINGTLYDEGRMTLVLDGYSAPLSAGNFLDLVSKGFYDGNDVLRSDGFIVQAGKPKDGEGYKDPDTGAVRTVPLEIFAKGDKTPTYGLTLEEDGRGAAGTVLPFTSFGTLAMARTETVADSASSQFFWFLFEPDLTPAGRNLMDGNWAVFGYTTKGESFLKGLQKGDTIVSAKVVDGLDNLVR